MAKVAIIGGGRRCMLILATLYGEKDVDICYISDRNPDAPAASLARELGIPFTTDYHDLFKRDGFDFIINSTDSEEISHELQQLAGEKLSIIDGRNTELFLNLLDRLKRDRDEIQRRNEILADTKAYLNSILDCSTDMIATTDLDGRIVEFNKGGTQILGYTREEAIGEKASDLWLYPEERERLSETLKRHGGVSNYEAKLKAKDGRVIDVSLGISLLRDSSGAVIGTVGISKDITEKKLYEEELKKKNLELKQFSETLEEKVVERTKQLEETNRELERANKLKSQFIANMSHELRTPLSSIIGFSEAMLEGLFGEINEKYKRYVNNIHTSGKHLLHLINNILDLAKIESGKMALDYEHFHFGEAVNEVLAIITSLSNKKNVSLSYTIDPSIEDITADRVKLKQILYNLLSNAIKFTPEGGSVTLEAGVIPAPESSTGQDTLRVSVNDTGIGITPQDQDRIWNEFEQADGTLARKYEGTGLGLALSKRFVEMHGGFIWVESEHGKGSTFSFMIPTFIGAPAEEAESRDRLEILTSTDRTFGWSAPGKRQKILIVEDDLAAMELLTLQLTSEGYEVFHAYDGNEAIIKAREIKPFAIILDIMLPKKDGWEVLQSLKLMPETKDTPVVISSVIENKELGFALGATDYLTKPVDRKTLLGKIEELSFTKKKAHSMIRVLAIDDNPDAVELIASFLEPEGYTVIKAYSGKEGLEKAIEIRPDLILLDLMMPEMDGFEVAERLKAHPVTNEIPTFIVTAKDITVEDRMRLAGQIERIIQKGTFSKEDIVRQIKDIELLHPRKAGMLDEVSGLFNHSYFQIRLAQELSRAERYKQTTSLLLIDIDDFGNYRDSQGDIHANSVIRKISELIRKSLRGSDVVVRYGFDEFAVSLTNTVKPAAFHVARRFKSMTENYPFYKAETLPKGKITLSIGIASYPEDGKTPEELILKASHALRQAKMAGGNQVFGS